MPTFSGPFDTFKKDNRNGIRLFMIKLKNYGAKNEQGKNKKIIRPA